MLVRSLIRHPRLAVPLTTPVEKIWSLLSKNDISLLAVVDEEKKLRGVIDEDDLLFRLVPDYYNVFSEYVPEAPDLLDMQELLEKEILLTAREVMNPKAITVLADQPVFKALAKMIAYHHRMLPVVDSEHRFRGMIAEEDIMQLLLKRHKNIVKRIARKRDK